MQLLQPVRVPVRVIDICVGPRPHYMQAHVGCSCLLRNQIIWLQLAKAEKSQRCRLSEIMELKGYSSGVHAKQQHDQAGWLAVTMTQVGPSFLAVGKFIGEIAVLNVYVFQTPGTLGCTAEAWNQACNTYWRICPHTVKLWWMGDLCRDGHITNHWCFLVELDQMKC